MSSTELRSSNPADLAFWIIENHFKNRLYSLGSNFYYYSDEKRWVVADQGWMSRALWNILAHQYYTVKSEGEEKTRRIIPTRNLIDNVAAAITAYTQLTDQPSLPFWINPAGKPDPRFLIEFENCILDVKASAAKGGYVLLEKTQEFVNTAVINTHFDTDAECPLWDRLCGEWSGGDPDWVECRNRCYGYSLMAYRGYAKWLLEYGKPRSGKGTATNVILRRLLEVPNIYFTKVRNLADTFGLDGPDQAQTLIIGEADELATPSEGRAVVSIIKSAVGGDPVPIRVMYQRGQANTIMRCFPIMQCNEMPTLPDSTQGLMSKMIPLYFPKSFARVQDPTIADRLVKELPGIALRWADAAIRLVQAKGNFNIPKSGEEVVDAFRLSNNPAEAFCEEYFVEDPNGFISADVIKALRKKWEAESGLKVKRSDGTYINDHHLLASLPQRVVWDIKKGRKSWSDGDKRVWGWGITGMSLRESSS